MVDLHPVVAALDHRSRALDLPSKKLASRIGVSTSCVTRWRAGSHGPLFGNILKWADVVGLRVAAVDGGEVVAEGPAIIADLANLRERRGILQGEIARIRSVAQPAVSRLERSPKNGTDAQLAAVEAQLSALGLRLTVLPGRRNAAA